MVIAITFKKKIHMKKALYLLGLSLFVLSCEQPEIGYISDNIHAPSELISVPRGVFYAPKNYPVVEGTTYPIEWSLTGVTDKNGNPTTELTDLHEMRIWKEAFDPRTDTTLEIAMKKLVVSNEPPMILNPVSGDFVFTQTTRFVPGSEYTVSVKAKNLRGERVLDNYAKMRLTPFVPVEIMNSMTAKLECRNNITGAWLNIGDYNVDNAFDAKVPSILDGTNPYMTIVKVSDEPKSSIKVIHIVTDSNNQALDPRKVVFNPDRLANFHDNTIGGGEMDAVGTTFTLPAPPFPQYSGRFLSNDSNNLSNYWMYYLTTTDSFTVDKAACEAFNKGPINWALYTNPATGNVYCRGYIRWAFKINDTGTWKVTMKIPNSIKK